VNGEKWNGKGKEYYDRTEFVGEYLNGERWNGKFKEYCGCGSLLYEGEYLNGILNKKVKGYCKMYYHDNKSEYDDDEYDDNDD